MITAGIDIGSITAKAAVIKDGEILGVELGKTGYNPEEAANLIFNKLLDKLSLKKSDIEKIIATGYGRDSVNFADKTITEITCHGRGAYYLNKDARTVIDIGGQDSKALLLNDNGKVIDFVMNDKCAAGTGRFIEVMAGALHLELDDIGELSLNGDAPSQISSICTVFAESEVISLISKRETRENISGGIHESVAKRVYSLARRIKITPPIMMTGGVAKNIGVIKALEKKFGREIYVSEYSQINGAIGAAILAGEIV